MTTAERFWFALGWALGADQVAPEHALEVMDKVAGALRDCHPGEFTGYVLGFIYPSNEMRDELCTLAERLAWERSAAAAIQRGEEELDAYFRSEEATVR